MHLSDEELVRYNKQIARDSIMRWKCKRCFVKSLKKKDLKHTKTCERRDNSRIKRETGICRAAYFGHHCVFSIGNQEAMFRCYTCGYEWISGNGDECRACGSNNRNYGPNQIKAKRRVLSI